MADAAWKAFERRVAKTFGGHRRGPLTRGVDGAQTDVVVEGYAIECKLLSRPSFQQMLEAALQAEHNAVSAFRENVSHGVSDDLLERMESARRRASADSSVRPSLCSRMPAG